MKKMISITISVLLAAGAASLLVGDEWYYTGSATGTCGCDPDPFGPWCGYLRYDEPGYADGFTGYWGGDEANPCTGGVYETSVGGLTAYRLTNGTWNTGGGDPDGDWDCLFIPSADTAHGTWDSEDVGCTGGTLWGNVFP